ncbi:hypothetical protein AAGW05_14215 [Arthrobacter sp. LAPM80]|uniref:hypothetical protein n=1 Tax=Arthrobacter sp. LAPM80 TaxID=3141788 RepID=UPI00398B4D0B
MTENSWPHDEGLEMYEPELLIPNQAASTVPAPQSLPTPQRPPQGADSKPVAAKEEAGEVARLATEGVQNVTDTARDEAANVVAEVKINARELMAQAVSDLTEQAATQQKRVAEGLRSISEELHSMVSATDQPGLATDLVRQAAERSAAVASWLTDRDPGSLLAEVKTYARHKPGTFLLLAAGAGIVAGRLTRSLSAGAPKPTGPVVHAHDTISPRTPAASTAVTRPPAPPAPTEAPVSDTPASETPTTEFPAAYPLPPVGETGTYPAGQSGTHAQTGPGRPELWSAEPVVIDPLPEFDPLSDDPFDGGRQ